MRSSVILALMVCCVSGSGFCSREDAAIVTAIQDEINGAMNPQSSIDLATDAFVQYVSNDIHYIYSSSYN